MSRHPFFKVLAVLLCALSLAGGVLTGGGMLLLQEQGLYASSMEDSIQARQNEIALEAAQYLVKRCYLEDLAGMPQEILDDPWLYQGMYHIQDLLYSGKIYYRITAEDSGILKNGIPAGAGQKLEKFFSVEMDMALDYPVLTPYEARDDAAPVPPATVPGRQDAYLYSDVWELYSGKTYQVDVYQGPLVHIAVYLEGNVWRQTAPSYWNVCELLYPHRYRLLAGAAGLGLLALLMLAFLGAAAGRGKTGPVLRGQNRLPLDAYGLFCAADAVLLFPRVVRLVMRAWRQSDNAYMVLLLAAAGGLAVIMVLPWIGCFCAWMAQLKCRCCLKNSLTVRFVRWTAAWAGRIFSVMPLTWQWLLAGGILLAALLLAVVLLRYTASMLLLLLPVLLVGSVLFLYSSYALGVLLQGVGRMSSGDLSQKVDTRHLRGGFLDFGNQLNALADVTVEAAREQLRSQRMKTELITNVSHDIKTPLTSIINYVDILKHVSTEEERAQYLEVLSRQSLRLKKLIEDLMELSKASTGNMPVELTQMDAAEAVNQALGEYADKLAALPLTVIFPRPAAPMTIRADGRLLWRTLSNLLQNICKYAMPGTRLYVDLVDDGQEVCICMKNISREELNVSAEELMERFVRGDKSRNTEGSGLGLNIARSLMELQQGRLELLVEGDLFRACLIFPRESR